MNWELAIAELQELLSDSAELLLERQRASGLNLPLDTIQNKLTANIAVLRKRVAAQEQELSNAEGSPVTPANAMALKEWEKNILDINSQIDRLERSVDGCQAGPLFGNASDELQGLNDGIGSSDLIQLQTRMMQNQDTHLDELSKTIARQKEIGVLLGDELEYHVELLEQTEMGVDAAQQRIRGANQRADSVLQHEEGDSRLTYVIVALSLVLLVVIIY